MYSCSFVDEVIYGPEDVNAVVGDLVGAGIAPFISKDSYTPEDLNTLTAAVVSSGTALGGCMVTRRTSTSVSIAPGIIYFGNGLRLNITSAHSLTVPSNTAVTVYAKYISSSGKAELTYSTSSVVKSDYDIPLALISADGTITDVRDFAVSKAATFGTNASLAIPESKVTVYENYDSAPNYNDSEKIVARIDLSNINLNRFNYFFYYYFDDSISDDEDDPVIHRLWDFKNLEKQNFIRSLESGANPSTNYIMYVTRNFNEILFIYSSTNSGNYWQAVSQLNAGKQYFRLI